MMTNMKIEKINNLSDGCQFKGLKCTIEGKLPFQLLVSGWYGANMV